MSSAWTQYHVIAERRIPKILSRLTVANMRTLEQKIADAGPPNLRVDPHILTEVRKSLVRQNKLVEIYAGNIPWYHLPTADPVELQRRLTLLVKLHNKTQSQGVFRAVGQALEIATFRALKAQSTLHFLGAFIDLDEHDDSTLYKKEEPPSFLSGRAIPAGKKKLDFIVHLDGTGFAGIELKNVREWFYPDRAEVRELLFKSCALDIVPVLIARRIHFTLFNILTPCGVITHETYNQLYPYSKRLLANQLSHKDLLGYHDIRVGNLPDDRLTHFIHKNLPSLMPAARERFNLCKDLLDDYANQRIDYSSFAEKVRLRTGT